LIENLKISPLETVMALANSIYRTPSMCQENVRIPTIFKVKLNACKIQFKITTLHLEFTGTFDIRL